VIGRYRFFNGPLFERHDDLELALIGRGAKKVL